MSALFEADLTELNFDERLEFLKDAGLENSSLVKLIKLAYQKLGLITFYTIESEETRAWPIKKGITAPEAAGKIHTDMEKGFIKAEVVNCQDLIEDGSFQEAREKGHLKIEGREYVVQDEDVILIKFTA